MAMLNFHVYRRIDYDKLINYLLIAYAFSLPLTKAGVSLFGTLIILLWLIQGDWKRKYQLYKNNLLILSLFSLILLSILSIPWASSTSHALEYISKYKHFLIILPIFSSLDTKFVKHIFSAFLSAIFLSELISYGIFFELWQYKNILPTDPSPFIGRIDYSIYLSFASILLLSRILDKSIIDVKLNIAYIFFFITSTGNLFINGGRTGQVIFIFMVLINVIMHLEHKIKAFFIAVLLLSTIFTTAYIYSPNFQSRANLALMDIQQIVYKNDYTQSIGQRTFLWMVGIQTFQDNFLFGKGIGNNTNDMLHYTQSKGKFPEYLLKFPNHHSAFLNISVQLGVFGLISLLMIFYSIFRLPFQSKAYKILNLSFFSAIFISAFGSTTFHTMSPMIFFALFAGIFSKISQLEFSKNISLKAEDNPISIKYYVKRFFQREKNRFHGKIVVDFPTGNGITSKILQNIGAIPISYDLFPEYCKIDGLQCTRANINEGIPLGNEAANAIICQEGIEHFENQLLALREFNRILKPQGSLIITTPNASNMIGKLSYFLSENELFNKVMPQNELDDIWMSNQAVSNEVYYGHIFLIGINKLRLLAKLSGFRIKHIEKTKIKTTAVILLIFFYPFIFFSNWLSYRRNLRKNKDFSMAIKKEVYGEIFNLSVNPRLLINSHIFIEFEKCHDVAEVKDNLPSKHKNFGTT